MRNRSDGCTPLIPMESNWWYSIIAGNGRSHRQARRSRSSPEPHVATGCFAIGTGGHSAGEML
jgi:hypothetical protein